MVDPSVVFSSEAFLPSSASIGAVSGSVMRPGIDVIGVEAVFIVWLLLFMIWILCCEFSVNVGLVLRCAANVLCRRPALRGAISRICCSLTVAATRSTIACSVVALY